MILYTCPPTITAAAAAMALASAVLGLVPPLVSAAAIQDTARADTLGLLPSRQLSPRAEAVSGAPIVAIVTTTVVVQDTTTTTTTTTDTATATAMATDTATLSVDATTDGSSSIRSVASSGNNATTSFAMPSQSCDLLYCDNGTSYCLYWGGYSSYDYSEHHPVPGETRTAIGTCRRVTTSSSSVVSPTPANGLMAG